MLSVGVMPATSPSVGSLAASTSQSATAPIQATTPASQNSDVAVDNPSVGTNGDVSNSGTPSGASSATGTVAGAQSTAPGGDVTLAAQVLTLQGNVIGAVPGGVGATVPVPAVVAMFAAAQQTAVAPAGGTPLASGPLQDAAPKPGLITGGDVAAAGAATVAPLSPALPPTSAELSNEARDQVLQEFAQPQLPTPVNQGALNNLLQDLTDPIIPSLGPSPDLDDGSWIVPADPGISQAPQTPSDTDAPLSDSIPAAAPDLSLVLPTEPADRERASWASLSLSALAVYGSGLGERAAARQPGDVKRAWPRREERLRPFARRRVS